MLGTCPTGPGPRSSITEIGASVRTEVQTSLDFNPDLVRTQVLYRRYFRTLSTGGGGGVQLRSRHACEQTPPAPVRGPGCSPDARCTAHPARRTPRAKHGPCNSLPECPD